MEVPLSHRNHCSWNASSAVPPLIMWLTYVTESHICIIYTSAASLAHKKWELMHFLSVKEYETNLEVTKFKILNLNMNIIYLF